MLGLIVVVVFLEVVTVVWVVVVAWVVVVVVEVAAAQMAASRSAVGMFVDTGGGAGVELGAMELFDSLISFLKGGDVEVLFTLLCTFSGVA